jgi:hypothetical protein
VPVAVAAIWLTTLCGVEAAAQPGPHAATGAAATGAQMARAKELFRKGNELLDVGDTERALEQFRLSRDELPSPQNTRNAAYCLHLLQRWDEALELYEQLLTDFRANLSADELDKLSIAMRELRTKVGNLRVSSNVAGEVLVDGRARGRLPLQSPVRVLPGSRTLRVIKDGYAPFEKVIEVAAQQDLAVDARLRPLEGAGVLRVEDAARERADVFVDGVRVGKTPWEGIIAPGKHVVHTRAGEFGSAPTTVVVVGGQSSLARVASALLGPEMSVAVVPPSAQISIDDVAIGSRRWTGRLPVGDHLLAAAEPGYLTRTASFRVTREAAPDQQLALPTQPDHPRWPKPREAFVPEVRGFVGAALAPSMASGAEEAAEASAVRGVAAGVRAAVTFTRNLAGELTIGYLGIGMTAEQRSTGAVGDGSAVDWRVTHDVQVHGGFFALGGSFRYPVVRPVSLVARWAGGLLIARVTDPLDVQVTANGTTEPGSVRGRPEGLETAAPFFWPEVGAELSFGRMRVGAAVAAAIFPFDGPKFGRTDLMVGPCAAGADAASPSCARNERIEEQRAFGPLTVWIPQVSAGYSFH